MDGERDRLGLEPSAELAMPSISAVPAWDGGKLTWAAGKLLPGVWKTFPAVAQIGAVEAAESALGNR